MTNFIAVKENIFTFFTCKWKLGIICKKGIVIFFFFPHVHISAITSYRCHIPRHGKKKVIFDICFWFVGFTLSIKIVL